MTSIIRFGLLGPLSIEVGDQRIDLGSPKHRIILSALLLNFGRPVSLEELTDLLWCADPPTRPDRVVRLYVTRLRAALGDEQRQLIVTRNCGYAIEIEAEQLDLARFEFWRARARQAADRRDLDGEEEALRRALAQWRGQPLLDVPSEELRNGVVSALLEQRLRVLTRRIEVDLHHRGHHEEMVSELSDLVARYPLREQFWKHLMTALNGAGRRSEALLAYHRARRHLAEELGTDPTAELRRLYQETLIGAQAGSQAFAFDFPIPRQLPPDLNGFVGRDEQLAQLDTLMNGRFRADALAPAGVAVLTGPAGMGKTALALRWARRNADQFPDGQIWLELRSHDGDRALAPGAGLQRILRALGVPESRIPSGLEDKIGLYRSLLDGRRVLVVLDQAGGAEAVRPLLPGAPGSMALITSRDRMRELVIEYGARPITLDPLTVEESRRLLAARLGADRVEWDQTAVAEIVAQCAGSPLALAAAASRAAGRPGSALRTVVTPSKERARPSALGGAIRSCPCRSSGMPGGDRTSGTLPYRTP